MMVSQTKDQRSRRVLGGPQDQLLMRSKLSACFVAFSDALGEPTPLHLQLPQPICDYRDYREHFAEAEGSAEKKAEPLLEVES